MADYQGGRRSEVPGLKELKSPDEGGNKKDLEDFLSKIENHIKIEWPDGPTMGETITKGNVMEIEKPKRGVPTDPNDADEKDLLESSWERDKEDYWKRKKVRDENMRSAYTLIFAKISKINRSKVMAKEGYADKNRNMDLLWLLGCLEDIMTKFEKIKPPELAMEDQMIRMAGLKQKDDESNEDFVKLITKEIKLYEKHGGQYLWCDKHDEELKKKVKEANESWKSKYSKVDVTPEIEKEHIRIAKKTIKDGIAAVAIFRRLNKEVR